MTTHTPDDDRTGENATDDSEDSGTRQVSEVRNLQEPDNDRGFQIDEGIPPEAAARQEEDGPPDDSEGNAVRSTTLREDV